MTAEHPSDVVGHQWEVNDTHPRRTGVPYSGGGDRVVVGQRGPVFPWVESYLSLTPWGLTLILIMRNGQQVRVRPRR